MANQNLKGFFAALISVLLLSTTVCCADEDPYRALKELITLTSKDIGPDRCSVSATVDFEGYTGHLALFRESWLNEDYSLDFYNQRRKQVFLYFIVKRVADVMTIGLYGGAASPPVHECTFAIAVKSFDNFGQSHVYPAVSWKFNRAQNAKVAWDHTDPKNFQDIALEYSIAGEMKTWLVGEPSMTNGDNSPSGSGDSPSCDEQFLRANAIFVRASAFCKKDYMDTPAGYYALAMSKKCTPLGEKSLTPKIRSAMAELDAMIRQKGAPDGCRWVDELERTVIKSMSK
jgi:hypothetical protein